MKLFGPFVFAASILAAAAPSGAQIEKRYVQAGMSKGSIDSKVMDETRRHIVHVPANYDKTPHKRYPVMYVLGGSMYAEVVVQLSVFIRFPEMILVSVEHNFSATSNRIVDLTPTAANPESQQDHTKNRYGGGADKLLEYIEKELIPFIDKEHRTLPHRTLVGHSVGGLAVLYAFTQKPGLFRHYLSLDASAWWDDQVIVRILEDAIDEDKDLRGRIFLALGEKETTGFHDDSSMLLGNRRFADLLEHYDSPKIKFKLVEFEGEDHGSVLLPGVYYGMRYLWDGYTIDRYKLFTGGVERLTKQYEALSNREGIELFPPPRWVAGMAENAGELAIGTSDREKRASYLQLTTDLLELGLKKYPDSSRILAMNGKYEENLGSKEKALEFYEAALRIDPDDEDAKEGLQTLKSLKMKLSLAALERLVGKYEGEGFPAAEIKLVGNNLRMSLEGISFDQSLTPKSETQFVIPKNQGGGTIEAKIVDGQVSELVVVNGSGEFTLRPVK